MLPQRLPAKTGMYYSSCCILLIAPFYLIFTKEITCIKNCLVFMLTINGILSITFWNNPIKNSYIHQLDSLFAKISFIFVVFYLKKITSIIIISIALILFYQSNKFSSKKWLSKNHILFHTMFHIVGIIGMCFALIP